MRGRGQSGIRRVALAVVAAGVVLAIAGAVTFWALTAPSRLDPERVAALPPGDPAAGERLFWAGGCASCHAAADAEGDALKRLGGGLELETPFGTFVAPNISPHETDGIGGWTVEDFANAMLRGVSPNGRHYYPAFPYTSYTRMRGEDVADLFAYLKTLPAVAGEAAGHDLGFPYSIRRGLGLWKRLYLDDAPAVALPGADARVRAGQYLVEGPGHCGACHTPRDPFGGPDATQWLAGAPNPEGPGTVPNLTPGGDLADWSVEDIAYYLESGFTPGYDSVGGAMVAVQENMARLTAEDRAAIAAYLKALPARPNGYPETGGDG